MKKDRYLTCVEGIKRQPPRSIYHFNSVVVLHCKWFPVLTSFPYDHCAVVDGVLAGTLLYSLQFRLSLCINLIYSTYFFITIGI